MSVACHTSVGLSELSPVVLVDVEERSHDDALGKLAAGETPLCLLTLIDSSELNVDLPRTYMQHRAQNN